MPMWLGNTCLFSTPEKSIEQPNPYKLQLSAGAGPVFCAELT